MSQGKTYSLLVISNISWDHSSYMAPRKHVGRLKGRATTQASPSTQAVNTVTSGFPALADEIYLKIMSYIPTMPIPSDSTTDPVYYIQSYITLDTRHFCLYHKHPVRFVGFSGIIYGSISKSARELKLEMKSSSRETLHICLASWTGTEEHTENTTQNLSVN